MNNETKAEAEPPNPSKVQVKGLLQLKSILHLGRKCKKEEIVGGVQCFHAKRDTHEANDPSLLPPWLSRTAPGREGKQSKPCLNIRTLKCSIIDLLISVPALVSPVAMITVTATRSFMLFGAT